MAQRLALMSWILVALFAAPSASANHGALDTLFNGSGTIVDTDTFGVKTIGGMVIQGDGNIVVAGTKAPDDNSRIPIVARYTSFGTHDGHFGNGGVSTLGATAPGGSHVQINDVALASGKLILAGETVDQTGKRVTFLERLHGSGSLDTTFGIGGSVLMRFSGSEFSEQHWSDVAIERISRDTDDYRIVVGGNAGGVARVARFTSAGSLISTASVPFESPNDPTTDVGGIALMGPQFSYGRDVAVASSDTEDVTHAFYSVSRFTGSSLHLVNGFGVGGTAKVFLPRTAGGQLIDPNSTAVAAIRTRADGLLDVGGRVSYRSSSGLFTDRFGLARFRPDGTLSTDTLPPSGGFTFVTSFSAYSVGDMVVNADGRMIFGGGVRTRVTATNALTERFMLGRFNADGSIDRQFGGSGNGATDGNGLVLTPKSAFAGGADTDGDLGEGADALALQSDGAIVAAGLRQGHFVLARYHGVPNTPPEITVRVGRHRGGIRAVLRSNEEGRARVTLGNEVRHGRIDERLRRVFRFEARGELVRARLVDRGGLVSRASDRPPRR